MLFNMGDKIKDGQIAAWKDKNMVFYEFEKNKLYQIYAIRYINSINL